MNKIYSKIWKRGDEKNVLSLIKICKMPWKQVWLSSKQPLRNILRMKNFQLHVCIWSRDIFFVSREYFTTKLLVPSCRTKKRIWRRKFGFSGCGTQLTTIFWNYMKNSTKEEIQELVAMASLRTRIFRPTCCTVCNFFIAWGFMAANSIFSGT